MAEIYFNTPPSSVTTGEQINLSWYIVDPPENYTIILDSYWGNSEHTEVGEFHAGDTMEYIDYTTGVDVKKYILRLLDESRNIVAEANSGSIIVKSSNDEYGQTPISIENFQLYEATHKQPEAGENIKIDYNKIDFDIESVVGHGITYETDPETGHRTLAADTLSPNDVPQLLEDIKASL